MRVGRHVDVLLSRPVRFDGSAVLPLGELLYLSLAKCRRTISTRALPDMVISRRTDSLVLAGLLPATICSNLAAVGRLSSGFCVGRQSGGRSVVSASRSSGSTIGERFIKSIQSFGRK